MKIAAVILSGLLLLTLAGCGGGGSPQTETQTPSPSLTSPSPTTQSPSLAPSTSPAPTPSSQIDGEIIPYPNAEESQRYTVEDTSPEGEPGTVQVIIMQTGDSYEQVKSYYEKALPNLWKKSHFGETTDEEGNKIFSLVAESPDGKSWFHLSVFENMDEGETVGISHALGKAGTELPSTPGEGEGAIPPYPNARLVNRSTYTGPGSSGEEAAWTVLALETVDDYDQVKGYYQANIPAGYTNNFSGESTDDGMRTYTLWLSSPDMSEIYTIAVAEDSEEGKVEIIQSYGHK